MKTAVGCRSARIRGKLLAQLFYLPWQGTNMKISFDEELYE
jgi:hypothetical protein